MGVNWVDFVLAGLVVMLMGIGIKRGFGKAIFDFAAILAALYIVSVVHSKAVAAVHLSADKSTNAAIVYSALVVLIGAACWFIGKLIYDSTLISLDAFDPIMGAVIGVGLAVVAGHVFTKTLALVGTINGKLPPTLAHSTLGMEFYDFRTYHNVVSFIAKLAD